MRKVKKLTIGIFLEHYDPFISGVISSVKSLRAELERKGHTVYIICPSAPGHRDSDPYIIRIPSFYTKSLENTTIGVPNPVSFNKLMKIDFDIIHSQEVFFTSALGLHVARHQRVPYIQTYHTLWDKFLEQYDMDMRVIIFGAFSMAFTYPFFFGLKKTEMLFKRDVRTHGEVKLTSRFMWRHMVVLASEADAVIVPSHHLQEALLSSGLKTPVHNVPNSISPLRVAGRSSILPPRKAKLRVLCVARLSPEKRIDVLLDAMSQLSKESVELFIIGEGPIELELKSRMKRLKLDNKVCFMGSMDNRSVRLAMYEADVLALASYDFDNQPMVFNEAFDAGLPIIYCDPRLGEGLNDNNSLLVAKDAQGFAAGFKKMISKSLREKMSRASRDAVRMHNSEYVAGKTLEIYENLIKSFKNH